MVYLEWNNAIIDHYFNPNQEEKEVILYFSESIIEEIGQNNFSLPDGGYVEDYYNSLRNGVLGTANYNYIQRIRELFIRKRDHRTEKIDEIPFKEPVYLAYFLTFILPFTSGNVNNSFTINNFHDIVKTFFKDHNLSMSYDRDIRHYLNRIDFLWEELNNWLIEKNDFNYGFIEIPEPPDNYKFAGKFLYHVLFRKEQEEKLSQVFDKEGILPNDEISRAKIKLLLVNYKNILRLSRNTIQAIKQENFIGNRIINRALGYYNDWDGTEYSELSDDNKRGYSRNRMVLCINYNRLSGRIIFKHLRLLTNKEYPEELSLISKNGFLIEDIFQDYNNYSSPIEGVFKNLKQEIELVSESYRWKFNWPVNNYYLFERDQIGLNEWVQIQKINYHSDNILIVFKKDIIEFIEGGDWLSKFGSKAKVHMNISTDGIDSGWSALNIRGIIDNQHPNIKELQIDTSKDPSINFDRSFYKSGVFYINSLPMLSIENNQNCEEIWSKYDEDDYVELKSIIVKDEEGIIINRIFQFTLEHEKRLNERFKLVTADFPFPKFYELSKFQKIDNETIDEFLISRNRIGQLTNLNESYFKGLDFSLKEELIKDFRLRQGAVTGVAFYNREKAINFTCQGEYNPKLDGNILIEFISTFGTISVGDFNRAKQSLLIQKDSRTKKSANFLRFKLEDLGFLEYDNSNGTVTVNKPTFLIKPSLKGTTVILTGARDSVFINRIVQHLSECPDIFIDIQNQSNFLLPQIIYLKFKSNNHSEVLKFAEEFGIIFNRNNLYLQYVFGKFFANLKKWENYFSPITDKIKDIHGGEQFDINSLKFIEKPVLFNKNLSLIKFSNVNGYKTIYRFWNNNEAYDILNQQLGIYLLLYMNKMQKKTEYENCLDSGSGGDCSKLNEEFKHIKNLTNILIYDRIKKYLAVPVTCKFPKYLNLSVSLLDGRKSEIKYLEFEDINYKGFYVIYKNVESVFVDNIIAKKLNQKLKHRSLII